MALRNDVSSHTHTSPNLQASCWYACVNCTRAWPYQGLFFRSGTRESIWHLIALLSTLFLTFDRSFEHIIVKPVAISICNNKVWIVKQLLRNFKSSEENIRKTCNFSNMLLFVSHTNVRHQSWIQECCLIRRNSSGSATQKVLFRLTFFKLMLSSGFEGSSHLRWSKSQVPAELIERTSCCRREM